MKSERFHLGTAEILVGADAEETLRIAAGQFAAAVRQRSSGGQAVYVALSGGSDAGKLFPLLAEEPFTGIIPWENVHVFWVDERNVPPGHPENNYSLARELLLTRVPLPADHVHRIPTGDGTAIEAAEFYQRTLHEQLPQQDGQPCFDYVLLGLGPDAHTASLFPHRPTLHEEHRLVAADHVDEVGAWRVTLTAAAINNAAQICFLAMGEEKASAVQRVIDGPRDPEAAPAQLIAPRRGSICWVLDPAAAHLLPRPAAASPARQHAGETGSRE